MERIRRFLHEHGVTALIALLALAKIALHVFTGARYGFFVDEFYTIALSRHPAFGYVDVPPLTPLLCSLSMALFGDSIHAMHVLPALAGAGVLVFVCLTVREFGGNAFAVLLAGLGFLGCSVWMIIHSIFAYDAFDSLVLAAFLYVTTVFLRRGNPRTWLLLGLLAGIACMTKMTLISLAPGFLVALLLSQYRKHLLTPWPWLGAALCVLLVSPYLLWQFTNDWPTLTYWTNYGAQRLTKAPLAEYLLTVIFDMNPVLVLLWVPGLLRLFRPLRGVRYAFLGIWFLVSFGVLFLLHARTWMLASLFIPLIAAGAVAWEAWLSGNAARLLKPALAAVLLAGGVLYAPASIPVLPLERLPEYFERFGFLIHQNREFNMGYGRYPTNLSLRIGWEDIVKETARVYDSLPANERAVAGIYAQWYGPAAAVDYYAGRYGLPHAVSGHLNYYLWGPGYTWQVMILLANGPLVIAPYFRECERKKTVESEFSMSLNEISIYVCKDPYLTPDEIWGFSQVYY